LAFGEDHDAVTANRIASCQTISGTGSLRIGFDFLRTWFPNKEAKIYVPDPTWPTHRGIAEKAGFKWENYRYYNRKSRGFDIDGMLEDLTNAENEQIVVLHSCAHNPTG
jgi:aspartate/tyrosine/aromatic aminotransferase